MAGYPEQLFDMAPVHPGSVLRQLMDERGWTQDEVAAITGLTRQTIHHILKGRSNITTETAARLAAAFGNTAEEWIRIDGLFRLATMQADARLSQVGKLARLYAIAPIRDMQRRGWINDFESAEELESELKRFFGQDSLDGELTFPVATQRSLRALKLNPSEKAWCFCARTTRTPRFQFQQGY